MQPDTNARARLDARRERLVDEALDARPQRQLAALDELHEQLRLELVQLRHKGSALGVAAQRLERLRVGVVVEVPGSSATTRGFMHRTSTSRASSSRVRDCGAPNQPWHALGHAFLAAADLEQLAVLLHAPHVRQPRGGKRSIERDAVPIALRVRQHAVTVEQ